jgi:hypothetical protein
MIELAARKDIAEPRDGLDFFLVQALPRRERSAIE